MEQVDGKTAADIARQVLAEQGRLRSRDVAQGLETARLAGLIVQREGYGMLELLKAMYGPNGAPFGHADVDAVVVRVDPDWREQQSRRWETVADLDLSRPRAPVAGG